MLPQWVGFICKAAGGPAESTEIGQRKLVSAFSASTKLVSLEYVVAVSVGRVDHDGSLSLARKRSALSTASTCPGGILGPDALDIQVPELPCCVSRSLSGAVELD